MTYIGTAYREYGLVYKGKNFNETRGVASLEECIQMCKDSARCRFWWYECRTTTQSDYRTKALQNESFEMLYNKNQSKSAYSELQLYCVINYK